MGDRVWLKTIYKCDKNRKPLISGSYDKGELEVWVTRARTENNPEILMWEIVNVKGEVLC